MHFWKRPEPFIPNKPPVFPAWTKTKALKPAVILFPDWREDMAGDEYVRRFNELNNLAHHPVRWVKPPLGNWG